MALLEGELARVGLIDRGVSDRSAQERAQQHSMELKIGWGHPLSGTKEMWMAPHTPHTFYKNRVEAGFLPACPGKNELTETQLEKVLANSRKCLQWRRRELHPRPCLRNGLP